MPTDPVAQPRYRCPGDALAVRLPSEPDRQHQRTSFRFLPSILASLRSLFRWPPLRTRRWRMRPRATAARWPPGRRPSCPAATGAECRAPGPPAACATPGGGPSSALPTPCSLIPWYRITFTEVSVDSTAYVSPRDGGGMSLRSCMRAAIASSSAWTARAMASSRSSPKVVNSGKSGDVASRFPSSSSSVIG